MLEGVLGAMHTELVLDLFGGESPGELTKLGDGRLPILTAGVLGKISQHDGEVGPTASSAVRTMGDWCGFELNGIEGPCLRISSLVHRLFREISLKGAGFAIYGFQPSMRKSSGQRMQLSGPPL